ncbi:DUF551 domain-containing protein [Raoultella ornithinolytica]|uniref:DUF551 domain-containing protein n=1 Tax=Raoultella ornithinolytica TaxID=54291 RepID=UPI00388FC14A
MTNNQLTRERLEKIKSWRETYGAGSNVMLPAEEAEELARMILAAMDSEPVAWMHNNNDIGIPAITVSQKIGHYWMAEFKDVFPLYRHAQPAPVVPEVINKLLAIIDRHTVKLGWGEKPITLAELVIARDGSDELEACRAAMLQAGTFRENGNSSTNNFREITETSTNSPALSPSREHFISLCNEFWGWSDMDMICADDKGYEPRLEWNGQSFTHPVTRGLWRMYQATPGNSPVIPDRWIPVSYRMPDDDDFVYIWPRPDFGVELHVGQYCECSPKGDGWYAQVYEQNYGIEWYPITVTHWMPLPADPQEVKSDINALIPLVSRNEQEVK